MSIGDSTRPWRIKRVAQLDSLLSPLSSPIVPNLKEVPNHFPIIIAAYLQEQLIGVLVTHFYPIVYSAKVQLLWLITAFEKNPILIQDLFSALEAELQREKCRIVICHYLQEHPDTPQLQSLLAKNQWHGFDLLEVRSFYAALLFNPPWFKKRYSIPPDWTLFPWKDLSPQEKEKLKQEESNYQFPSHVSPLAIPEESIEPINSLGVRYKNRVVGWMITQRSAPDLIQYSALYLEKDLHPIGIAIQLVREAVLRQQMANIPRAYIQVNIRQVHLSWRHFLQKKLLPYADTVTHIQQCWHVLGETTGCN